MPFTQLGWKNTDKRLPFEKEHCENCSHPRNYHNDNGCNRLDGCIQFRPHGQLTLTNMFLSFKVSEEIEEQQRAKQRGIATANGYKQAEKQRDALQRLSRELFAKEIIEAIRFSDNGFAFMEIYHKFKLVHSKKQSLINALNYGIEKGWIAKKEDGRYYALEVITA